MRVLIKSEETERPIVIEVIQTLHYDSGKVGFILPYSEYAKAYNYTHYVSDRPLDDTQYSLWCRSLMRDGYLDTTNGQLKFKPHHPSKNT